MPKTMHFSGCRSLSKRPAYIHAMRPGMLSTLTLPNLIVSLVATATVAVAAVQPSWTVQLGQLGTKRNAQGHPAAATVAMVDDVPTGHVEVHAGRLFSDDRALLDGTPTWLASSAAEWHASNHVASVRPISEAHRSHRYASQVKSYDWGIVSPTSKGGILTTYYHHVYEWALPTADAIIALHKKHGGQGVLFVNGCKKYKFCPKHLAEGEQGPLIRDLVGPAVTKSIWQFGWMRLLPVDVVALEAAPDVSVRELAMGPELLGVCNPLNPPSQKSMTCQQMHRRVRDYLKQAAFALRPVPIPARRTRSKSMGAPAVLMLVREQWQVTRTRRISNWNEYTGIATLETTRVGGVLKTQTASHGNFSLLDDILAFDAADMVITQRGSAMGNLVFLRDGAVLVAGNTNCAQLQGSRKCESAWHPAFWIPTWYTTEDFILSGGNFDEFVTMDVASFSDSLKRGLALWNASETPVQT